MVPGGAAEKAGLQTGDVVTAVDDRIVTSSVDLTAAIRSTPPGQTVTLTLDRGGKSQKFQVTRGETSGGRRRLGSTRCRPPDRSPRSRARSTTPGGPATCGG